MENLRLLEVIKTNFRGKAVVIQGGLCAPCKEITAWDFGNPTQAKYSNML